MNRPRRARPAGLPRDVACAGCGYNLRGLNKSGKCPECGWLIVRSLKGPLLRHTHVDWLTKVANGLFVIHRANVALVVAFVVGVLTVVVGGIWMLINHDDKLELAATIMVWAGLSALVIWLTVSQVALFLATSFEPSRLGSDLVVRWIERGLIVSIPVTAVLWGLAMIGWPLLAGTTAHILQWHLLLVLAWAQSIVLSRWLNALDQRVDQQVLNHPTFIERLRRYELFRLLLSWEWEYGWEARTHRWLAYWLPAGMLGVYWWMNLRHGRTEPQILIVAAVIPLAILITMRGTVRAVQHELDAALGVHA